MKRITSLIFMALSLCLVTFVTSCKEDEETDNTGTAPVTGVTLSPATLTLTLPSSATATLTATVAPANAAVKTVSWSSNSTTVADVSETGVVTAKATGSATITVTTTEGNFTATCAVTVTAGTSTAIPWTVGETYLYENIWYKVVRAGEVAVVRDTAGQDYTGTIVVPATVNVDYTVKYVATHAFGYTDGTPKEDTHIEYVELPNTIVSFANCAFQNSRSLKKIEIPNSVVALSDDNFDGEDDLTVTLADGVTPASIGATFANCTGLEEVTIGTGITSLVAANGIFNNNAHEWASSLKKLTCRAATPPAIDDHSFMLGVDYAVFYVPQGSEDAYKTAVAGTIWGWTYGEAANVYAIGACVPVWSLSATNAGEITWGGDADAYKVVISTTELADPSTGTVRRATETTYDASDYVTPNTTNYVYVQSDCGDTWASTTFLPIENGCEYTVSGVDNLYNVDENDDYVAPMPWGWGETYAANHAYLEFWQNNQLVATVTGAAAFEGTTVTLISGVEVTVKWVNSSNYDYNDPCSLLIKQGENVILSKDDLVANVANPSVHTFTPSCN